MYRIFAAINDKSVTDSLITGLNALACPGYDFIDIGVTGDNGFERRRAEGKLENLKKTLQTSPLKGANGIANTRWATHGTPTEYNAHPHMTSRVTVVHNTIIENDQSLRVTDLIKSVTVE